MCDDVNTYCNYILLDLKFVWKKQQRKYNMEESEIKKSLLNTNKSKKKLKQKN